MTSTNDINETIRNAGRDAFTNGLHVNNDNPYAPHFDGVESRSWVQGFTSADMEYSSASNVDRHVQFLEGSAAHEKRKTTQDNPYQPNSSAHSEWNRGYWHEDAQVRQRDQFAIALWMDENLRNQLRYDFAALSAFANLLLRNSNDRFQPIEVRIGTLEFTIPAPAGLKDGTVTFKVLT